MVQVIDSKKDCDTCMKSDVCKFKDEYENLYHNIQDDFSCDNTIFEIKLNSDEFELNFRPVDDLHLGALFEGCG